jgi:pimeloyl-ACP methyl ester carboxylesterase
MFLQPYSWTRRLGVGILAALGLLIPTLVGFGEDHGIRQNVRKKIQDTFSEQTRQVFERYGLKPYGEGQRVDRRSNRPVILIHGLDEPGKVWMNLAPALHEAGFWVWVMNYPNDQSIRESAQFLLDEIQACHDLDASELILIAHSMGGLVAREMLSSPWLLARDRSASGVLPRIHRLILVGTPNHGSYLARFRVFAEVREQAVHLVKGEYHWLLPILDGTGQAGTDLLPGSDFLQALNQQNHPENLKILVIAGIMSPLQRDGARQMIQKLSAHLSPDGKKVLDRIAVQVHSVFNDLGDGAVSLDSATLDGIPLETVPGTHLSIIRNISPNSRRIPPAIPLILRALNES